jgi:hypothetical protein
MIAIETLLFGLVGGLIGVKLAALAAAAVLFVYGLTARPRQPRVAAAPATAGRKRLDVHV